MQLVWDEVGERRFETGIDRGVLYLPGGGAVPWNGLVAIAETLSREVKPYYLDGRKYLEQQVLGDYASKLSAFTYPDELDELLGNEQFAPGVFLHDQRGKAFSLAYRTREGDDLDQDAGYKLHVVYNVTATPSDSNLVTIGENVTPQLFDWTLNGLPVALSGHRPTSHISLHSRTIDPSLLAEIEETLYGTELVNPSLPSLTALLALVEA